MEQLLTPKLPYQLRIYAFVCCDTILNILDVHLADMWKK